MAGHIKRRDRRLGIIERLAENAAKAERQTAPDHTASALDLILHTPV